LHHVDYLKSYQGWLGRWLLAFDGTQYFHSTEIHCPQCTTRVVTERLHYSHALVAPLIVAPGHSQVIALAPAFITPQDGQEKQDCELRATERWLTRNAQRFPSGAVTVLGDDRYAHQPFCALLTIDQWHFAFTGKPESHAALYQEIELLAKVGGVQQWAERHHKGARREVWQYRYATRVPLRADMHPLYVNWCEVTITDEATGERLYHNAWATDHTLDPTTVHPFGVAARTRWKSENKNNNIPKNYGYHLDLRQLRARPAIPRPGAGHAECFRLPLPHRARTTPCSTCAIRSTAWCAPSWSPAGPSSMICRP